MDYHIIKISRNKKQYLDLLLLGDEQETIIDRYLERGDLFVLEDNGIKAVGVVTKEGPEICELKNIAVTPIAQRQGYGRKLINYLINHYSKEYSKLLFEMNPLNVLQTRPIRNLNLPRKIDE